MTQKAKLIDKVRRGGHNVRFNDATKAAEACGFVRKRQRGSHLQFEHPAIPGISLNLQSQGPHAKAYQVKQLVEYIDRYNLEDAD